MNIKTLLSNDGKELYLYIETPDDQIYLEFDITTARRLLTLLSTLIYEADMTQKLKSDNSGNTN